MIKWLPAFSLALAFAAPMMLPASAQQTPSLADLIEQVEMSVVRIETPDGLGSGFMASADGIVVTNLHVIAGAREAKIHFQDKREYRVLGVLVKDEERDLAILKSECRDATPLPVAAALPRKGDSVVAFGAPGGLSFSASEGIISAIRAGEEAANMLDKGSGTWLQTTAPISPGNSGGPLVNRTGEVVAVNTFYVSGGQNLNFAISCLDIAQLLADAQKVRVPQSLSESVANLPSDRVEQLEKSGLAGPLRDYIESSEQIATQLIAETDERIRVLETETRQMKSGRVNSRLQYPAGQGFRRELLRNRPVYFYASDEIKDALVTEATSRLTELKEVRSKMSDSGEGLVVVAMFAGPPLSLSAPASLGRIDEIKVAQVTGPHEFHGYIGPIRVSVQGVPTDTLLTNQVLTDGLFLFSGVEAYEAAIGGENRIARLTFVPNDVFLALGAQLFARPEKTAGAAVATATESGSSSFREWKDNTGNFSVVAKFVRIEGDSVELQRQTGPAVRVPISRLSEADQAWLKSNPD